MLTGLLLFAATISAIQQGPAAHYRITLKANRNLDRSGSGEAARGGTYNAVAYVTATTTSEGGKRMGHVVIDSVTCNGTGIMSMAFDTIVGKQSRGARYVFPIGENLEVAPVPSISNTLTNALAQTALMLFPTVERTATIGSVWTDSLDTSSMGESGDKNHPIVTRWKVMAISGDTTVVEGDVRGALTWSGRVIGTGLISGTRHLTAVGGMLRSQKSTVNTETLMAAEGATAITRGTATTVLEIVAIWPGRMTP